MANKNTEAAIIAAFAAAAVVMFSAANIPVDVNQADHNPEPTVAIVAKVKQPTQVPTEATQPVTEATAPIETALPIILYEVPLETELQLHIIQVAESYGIDPAIIFAMCYWESTYNPAAVGDNEASFGLMQIQPKWHSGRMARLNCSDLLDPFQNIIVGTDYLAEQLVRYDGNVSKALVAYNAGHYYGTITGYATKVMAKAEELRGTTYESHR